MKKLQNNTNGFTIIELLVFIVVLVTVAVVAVSNIRDLRAQNRDQVSKVDINAIFYQLELFHEKNGYYPETITADTLKGIDAENLKDRNGRSLNEAGGSYSFKPMGCQEARCRSFTLTAELEKEAPFVKQSLNS